MSRSDLRQENSHARLLRNTADQLKNLGIQFRSRTLIYGSVLGLATLPTEKISAAQPGFEDLKVNTVFYGAETSTPNVPKDWKKFKGQATITVTNLEPNKEHFINFHFKTLKNYLYFDRDLVLKNVVGNSENYRDFAQELQQVRGIPSGITRRISFVPKSTSIEIAVDFNVHIDTTLSISTIERPARSNIAVKVPVVQNDGSVLLAYEVEHADFRPDNGQTIKLELAVHKDKPFYFTVIFDKEISSKFVSEGNFKKIEGPSNNFAVGRHTFLIPNESIGTYFVAHDVLKAFVNRPFQNAEPKSFDNEERTALPVATISGHDFDGEGGLKFKINFSNYSTGTLKEVPVKIIWTTDTNLETHWKVGFISEIATIKCTNGQSVSIKSKDIKVPFDNHENLNIRLVVDPDDIVFQKMESRSNKSLSIPRLSFELATAPIARTPEERVKLWLKPYEKYIIKLSQDLEIDPRCITGVIAWEAMKNIDSTSSFKTFMRGPGKIHAFYEGMSPQAVASLFTDISAEAEEMGYVNPKMPDGLFRMDELKTGYGAIRYIAGIMAALASQSELYVVDGKSMWIRNRPDILAAWYQGFRPGREDNTIFTNGIRGIGRYFTNATMNGIKYTPVIPKKKSMGLWIQENMALPNGKPKLVDTLIRGTYDPKKRKKHIPIPNKDLYFVLKKSSAKLKVLDNDGDSYNRPRGLFSVSTPKNGTAVIQDDAVIYTPRAGFKGQDIFSYMSYDDEGIVAGADVEVNVIEPNPNAPGTANVISISQTTAKLRWQDLSDNEDRFVIEVRKSGGSWNFQENVPANTTEATITGLLPGQAYEARIKAVNVDGGYSISGAVAFNTKIGMKPPTSLKIVALSPTELAIDWNFNDPNAHRLQIMYRIPGKQDWAYMSDPGINDGGVEIQGLLANTTYEFRVRTVYKKTDGSEDASAWSETVSLTTPDFIAVKSASATVVSTSEVLIQFGFDGSGHNRFQLQRLDVATGNWIYLSDLGPDERAFKDTGLQANKEYRYRTRAIYPGEQTSNWKQTEIVRTQQLPPQPLAAPQSLAANAVYSSDVQLSWGHNLTDGQFVLQQWSAATGWINAKYVDARSRNTNITGLQPNTYYQIAVRFIGPDGRVSDPSNIIGVQTLYDVIEVPSGLRTNSPGPNSVRLEFDYKSSAANFIIEKWSMAQGWHRLTTISGTQKYYEVTGLTPSTDYQFAIRAVMPNGQISDHSNIVLIGTSSGVPASPNDLHRGVVGTNNFEIIWNDNANNETHYKVLVKPEGGSFNLSENVPADTKKAKIDYVKQGGSRLKPDTLYTVRVVATNGYGDSAYDEVQIRTKR